MATEIVANLRDTPYRFVRPIGRHDVELAYGAEIREQWRRVACFHGGAGRYVIRIAGVGYSFVQRLDGRRQRDGATTVNRKRGAHKAAATRKAEGER